MGGLWSPFFFSNYLYLLLYKEELTIIKIEQLKITNDNIWEILTSKDVYFVRFSKPKAKKSEGHKKETPSIPYGISFKNLGSNSISDVVELINSGEGAIVRVTNKDA